MKTFFWNIRGVNKEVAREKLREYFRQLRFEVLVLAEPMVVPWTNTVMKLGLVEFFDDIVHNGEGSRKANLWLTYKRGLSVDLIATNRQYLSVVIDNTIVTAVHAYSVPSMRKPL